jgi:hypothetical protein
MAQRSEILPQESLFIVRSVHAGEDAHQPNQQVGSLTFKEGTS